MNKRFLKKFYNSQAQFSFTLVICEFANVSLLSENHHMFAKITKNIKNGQTSSFFDFPKNPKYVPRVVRAEKSKTYLGFEIRPPQRKWYLA